MNDNIKNLTKKMIRQPNIYTTDCWKNFRSFFDNAKVRRFQRQIEAIDSIADYETFREMVKMALHEKKSNRMIPLAVQCFAGDMIYYGYYYEFAYFSGEHDIDLRFPAFTGMDHGVAFYHRWPFYINEISYCSLSNYWKMAAHNLSPNILFFPIGPYIHYSRKYYSEQQEKNVKDRLGRTLLVVPRHYEEWEGKNTYEKGYCLLNTVFEKYANDFDTILLSAYWYDVDADIFTEYERRGARIVSAGFRGDKNFVRRLKSIISLSDAVVFEGIGTNLGYCYHLNKPVFMEASEDIDSGKGFQVYKRFYEAFHSESMSFTEEQRREQKELYEQYWGGTCIRSSEEARAIIHVAREVRKRAHNVLLREFADKAVEQYWGELENRSDEEAKLERKIMLEALGR